MEDEHQNTLKANKDAEEILSRDANALGETACANQSKHPPQAKEQREDHGDEKIASNHRLVVFLSCCLDGVAAEGSHDDHKHDPVKDVDYGKGKQESKIEWPFNGTTAK